MHREPKLHFPRWVHDRNYGPFPGEDRKGNRTYVVRDQCAYPGCPQTRTRTVTRPQRWIRG